MYRCIDIYTESQRGVIKTDQEASFHPSPASPHFIQHTLHRDRTSGGRADAYTFYAGMILINLTDYIFLCFPDLCLLVKVYLILRHYPSATMETQDSRGGHGGMLTDSLILPQSRPPFILPPASVCPAMEGGNGLEVFLLSLLYTVILCSTVFYYVIH